MSRRLPSAWRAAAIRASMSASDRPRYCSGGACRSEIWVFSNSVSSGMMDAMVQVRARDIVKLFAISEREKGQTRKLGRMPCGVWTLCNYNASADWPTDQQEIVSLTL